MKSQLRAVYSSTELDSVKKRVVSFYSLWKGCVESQSEDRDFLQVAKSEAVRVQRYSPVSFFKRAVRHALVFQNQLELKPGDKIAVCAPDLNDFALILHGALLAHCVVIPIAPDASSAELKQILKSAAPKVFIFPAAYTANMASLIAVAPSVRHWVVTGKNAEGNNPQRSLESRSLEGQVMQRLEQLLLGTAGEEFQEPVITGNVPCGVVFAPGGKFLSAAGSIYLPREQLLLKAFLMAQVMQACAPSGRLWASASELSVFGCLFHFFLALFHPASILVRPGMEGREFWPQVLADDITFAVLTVPEFELIERKGKAKGWRKPDDFTILVSDDDRMDDAIVKRFMERFFTPVGVAYFSPITLEYASLRTPDDKDCKSLTGESGESLCTYGKLLLEAEIGAWRLPNLKTDSMHAWGMLRLRSMLGGDFVSVGARAAVVEVDGSPELYVVGKKDELIVRRSKLINLGRVNTLVAQLQGVVFTKGVPFTHQQLGQDYVLYVLPHRLSQMNKYDVELFLVQFLKRDEMPSSIIVEERTGLLPPENEEELRKRVAL